MDDIQLLMEWQPLRSHHNAQSFSICGFPIAHLFSEIVQNMTTLLVAGAIFAHRLFK